MYNFDTNGYIFIIDTEQYSGNFERQMIAYMTGRIGDCGVGDKEAKTFYKEMNLVDEDHDWNGLHVEYFEDLRNPFDFIDSRSDDHGISRPATIYPTEGWFNNGMGGDFRDGEEEAALEHYREECLDYAQKHNGQAHTARWEEKSREPLSKFPAYLSVATFMSRKPTEDEIKLLKERAFKFAENNERGREITITGFRLGKMSVATEEI